MGKKKKKPKFEKIWGNLTDIGVGFGMSAVKLGAILKEIGLRNHADGKPTEEALTRAIARATPLRSGHEHYMWHRQSVSDLLQKYGYSKKVDTKDPVHSTASEIHKIIEQSRRAEKNSQDKEAIFGYEIAIDTFQKTITNAPEHKRIDLAAKLYGQLKLLGGTQESLAFLWQDGPISWQEMEAHLSK